MTSQPIGDQVDDQGAALRAGYRMAGEPLRL